MKLTVHLTYLSHVQEGTHGSVELLTNTFEATLLPHEIVVLFERKVLYVDEHYWTILRFYSIDGETREDDILHAGAVLNIDPHEFETLVPSLLLDGWILGNPKLLSSRGYTVPQRCLSHSS